VPITPAANTPGELRMMIRVVTDASVSLKRALGNELQRSIKNKGFCSHTQNIFQSTGNVLAHSRV
jgi:hypothetical protein